MKLLILSVLVVSASAFAQTETPPPQPKTDEYGIPLKLKATPDPASRSAASTAPKKAAPMDTLKATPAPATAVLSGMDTKPAPKYESETSKPIPQKYRVRAAAPKKNTVAKGKSGAKRKSAAPQVVAPEVLENKATQELMLPKEDLTTGVLPTPATVRSRVDEVQNPIRPLVYRVGVSVQPFTPKGEMQVGDLQKYDMSTIGTGAMFALEGQWLPILFTNTPGLAAGPYASIGFAQFNLELRSPTGLQLDGTKLNVIKAQLGVTTSYQLPKSPLWSLHGSLGVGRLTVIQSSDISYANSSSAINYGSLGISAERSLLPKLSVFAAYDLRLTLEKAAGADVPNHNVLLGFLGNFE